MYPYIAPENFENSKISSITNDQLSIKISDLLEQKEITKYITTKEKLIEILEKYCEFFQFSEDKEKIQYILPEGMIVFSILNIPSKLCSFDMFHFYNPFISDNDLHPKIIQIKLLGYEINTFKFWNSFYLI